MSLKVLAAVVAVAGEGPKVNVSALCREAGVSRKTFYKWVDRVRTEGLAGLEERSRRPLTSPTQTPATVEELVVLLRKELADAGLDHGPQTLVWHLERDTRLVVPPPSVSTTWRILVRRGLVVPEPKKRPKTSWHRFEASAPNERWQIDAMDWVIATGVAKVFNIVDDHSRVAVRSRAVTVATSEQAWTTFCEGAACWGLPSETLSDNGLCFSGKLRGFEVVFEANLRDAGIRPITGRPYHPQTTGKVERFQQTVKKWLARQPMAANLAELQVQLDEFSRIYNEQRPHQGIGRVTPLSRWQAGTPARPADEPLPHPAPRLRYLQATVNGAGVVPAGHRLLIHVGVEWEGHRTLIQIDGHHANVFIGNTLVRHIHLDGRNYYGSGRPRGGPRRQRLTS